MADITMSVDDTLELDTIIQKSEDATKPISIEEPASFKEGTDFNLDGIQTHTGIFNPSKSGDYKLNINGQILTVRVKDLSTIPDTIVDSFEDGDLSEYSGDTGGWVVNNNKPVCDIDSGSYSAKSDFSSSYTEIVSTSGLSEYPSQGDLLYYYIHFDNGFSNNSSANARVKYGCQSETKGSDCYRVEFEVNNGTMTLFADGANSGSDILLDEATSVSYPEDEFLELKIPWNTDGSMSPTLQDLDGNQIASISGTDTSYTSGGIGLGNSDDQYDVMTVDLIGFD